MGIHYPTATVKNPKGNRLSVIKGQMDRVAISCNEKERSLVTVRLSCGILERSESATETNLRGKSERELRGLRRRRVRWR